MKKRLTEFCTDQDFWFRDGHLFQRENRNPPQKSKGHQEIDKHQDAIWEHICLQFGMESLYLDIILRAILKMLIKWIPCSFSGQLYYVSFPQMCTLSPSLNICSSKPNLSKEKYCIFCNLLVNPQRSRPWLVYIFCGRSSGTLVFLGNVYPFFIRSQWQTKAHLREPMSLTEFITGNW